MPQPDPVLRPLPHLAGSRDAAVPADRLRAVRKAAAALREELLDAAPVAYYGAFDLTRLPYPLRYGLRDACTLPWPYLQMVNRVFVLQFRTDVGVRTLLASPTDYHAARETPFFKRLARRMGPLQPLVEPLVAPETATVEQVLQRVGIAPEQVDYLTYDHLHTQDVRRWLGTADRPGVFPNAKLLVMRQEWHSAQGLLPPQRDWYCPGGIDGVDPAKVVLLDGDTALGEGVALVQTPGHTAGNHSIVVRTPEGLFVTSENGVSADNYAPMHSQIPGLRAYARDTGMDVVLNGNTLEGALDQYISMVLERDLAGPSMRDGAFYNVFPSSELDAAWLAPGLRPTLHFGEVVFGQPTTGRAEAPARPADLLGAA